MKRAPITKKLRFLVMSRDGFTCRYCGDKAPNAKLVLDHLIPVAGGGTNEIANLVTACQPCNAGKSDRPLNGAPSCDEIGAAALKLLDEQKESARRLMKAQQISMAVQGELAGFWSSLTGRASVEPNTLRVILSYVHRYGADLVYKWVVKAASLVGRNDALMGRYVSGCKRKHEEEIARGGML